MLIKYKKPIISLFFALFIFLTIALNFSNGQESIKQSNSFLDVFIAIINFFLPNRSLSTFEISGLSYVVRKFIGHFLLFAIDGFVSLLFFKLFSSSYIKITIIFGILFSIFCEFLQLLAGGRTFAFKDICLDFFSFTFLASLIYIIFKQKYSETEVY